MPLFGQDRQLLKDIKAQLDRMEQRMATIEEMVEAVQRAVNQLKERLANLDTTALQEQLAAAQQAYSDLVVAEEIEDTEQNAALAAALDAAQAEANKSQAAADALQQSVEELDAIAPGQVNPL